MGIVRVLCGAVAIGLAAVSAPAAETLTEAWSKALVRDAGLAAVARETEAARSGERAAAAGRWPQVEVGASYTRLADAPALSINTPAFAFVSPRIFSGDDFVMRHAQVTMPLYAGGSLSAGVSAARAARTAGQS